VDIVVAAAGLHRAGAPVGDHKVVARAGIDEVVAGKALDRVVAAVAYQHLGIGAALDQVVERGPIGPCRVGCLGIVDNGIGGSKIGAGTFD
jgi:hypothetical protein